MQYGEIKSIQGDDDKSIETTLKMHQGQVRYEKKEYKERVQIMRVTDLDIIIEQMRVDYGLDQSFGAWVEKNGDKLFAVKYRVTLTEPVIK